MELWQIALGVGGGLVAMFGLSWMVFSGLLKTMKSDVDGTFEHVNKTVDEHGESIVRIREELKEKPDYDHIELHYHRKDITDLHFKNICSRFDRLEEKIDELSRFMKNGHGK